MNDVSQRSTPVIGVFAGVNFALAALCLLALGLVGILLIYGVGFSGDRGQELVEGVLGCALLAAPSMLGFLVYLLAGLGLAYRRVWGYYCHCAGAVLAALTCIGVVYTVFAFVFAVRPEFSDAFFRPGRAAPRRRREAELWDED